MGAIDNNDSNTDDTRYWEVDDGWSGGRQRPVTAAQIETDDATPSDDNIMIVGIIM